MARSFYRDNKRVSNTRIKEELGVALAWPNYREGLQGTTLVNRTAGVFFITVSLLAVAVADARRCPRY